MPVLRQSHAVGTVGRQASHQTVQVRQLPGYGLRSMRNQDLPQPVRLYSVRRGSKGLFDMTVTTGGE